MSSSRTAEEGRPNVVLDDDCTTLQIAVIGDMRGIPTINGLDTETVPMYLSGEHRVEKKTGTAWTQGALVKCDGDATGGDVDLADAVTDVPIGYAAEAAASAATHGTIILVQGLGYAVP